MPYEENRARAAIRDWLDLPRQAAGMHSAQIRTMIYEIGQRAVMPEEFGPLTDEARTAIQTVASALMSMHDNAVDRERHA